jgi:hypothetical protein
MWEISADVICGEKRICEKMEKGKIGKCDRKRKKDRR